MGLFAFSLTSAALAADARPPAPGFVEDFDVNPAAGPRHLIERWVISGGLQPEVQLRRIVPAWDRELGRNVGRVTVEAGDALSGAKLDAVAGLFVCGKDGSTAHELTSKPGGIAPTERAEMQIRHNPQTRENELVRFGETTWYRFAFKIAGDWPDDRPINGRPACRTVIHQVKQDSFIGERSCNASPFFKIEARPLDGRVLFFGQIVYGPPCTAPATVKRKQICVLDNLPRDTWHRVNVRLTPAHEDGRVDMWLNGKHCGAYRGPMSDAERGGRRDGLPYINVQPRFGIYRDRRAETQTIFFDRIAFWNVEPDGHPDWDAGAN
jgi:hypothetical protein